MKVNITSQDVDSLIFTMAMLARFRELMPVKADGEFIARIAVAASVLKRLSTDAMLDSPVAHAFRAAVADIYPKTAKETE